MLGTHKLAPAPLIGQRLHALQEISRSARTRLLLCDDTFEGGLATARVPLDDNNPITVAEMEAGATALAEATNQSLAPALRVGPGAIMSVYPDGLTLRGQIDRVVNGPWISGSLAPIAPRTSVELCVDMLSALSVAHRGGLTHGPLGEKTVRFDRHGYVMLFDLWPPDDSLADAARRDVLAVAHMLARLLVGESPAAEESLRHFYPASLAATVSFGMQGGYDTAAGLCRDLWAVLHEGGLPEGATDMSSEPPCVPKLDRSKRGLARPRRLTVVAAVLGAALSGGAVALSVGGTVVRVTHRSEIPQVTGLSVAQATSDLARIGLRVSHSAGRSDGSLDVLGTTPGAGAVVASGATVTLEVSEHASALAPSGTQTASTSSVQTATADSTRTQSTTTSTVPYASTRTIIEPLPPITSDTESSTAVVAGGVSAP